MYALHAVIIDKSVPAAKARQMAQSVIKDPERTFMRETTESYRFRNIPKTRFDSKTFRSRVINDKMTLVFGRLKK